MAHLRGRVSSVRLHDEDTGYTFARLMPVMRAEAAQSQAIRGTMAYGLVPGEVVEVEGEWVQDNRAGEVLQVSKVERVPPASRDQEATYVASMVRGLSQKVAGEVLDHFGGLRALMDVCRDEPARLDEPLGGKRKLVRSLRNVQWDRSEVDPFVFTSLRSAGLRVTQINSLVRFFGAKALRQIAQTKPYNFCRVPQVGFTSAEKVAEFYAREQGRRMDLFDEDRLMYGMCEVVGLARRDGHVCAPDTSLIDAGVRHLRLPGTDRTRTILAGALDRAVAQALLVRDHGMLYTRGLRKAETDLARRILKIKNSGARPFYLSEHQIVRKLSDTPLSEEQKQAVATMGTSPISLLVGGPGRGKTRVLESLLDLLDEQNRTSLVLAPTGKAAKRASEVTGRECFTVHKAIGLDGSDNVHDKAFGSYVDAKARLRVDVVIVDEASMLDLVLAFELFRRVRAGKTSVVLVGDPDQLPPVSAGQVLFDLIRSDAIPVARLTRVFRQAGGSAIVDAADAINAGRTPEFARDGYEMRLFDPSTATGYPGAADAAAQRFEVERTGSWLNQALLKYKQDLRIDPLSDIQIYAPQRTGPLGLHALNERLQALLNPPKGAVSHGQVKIDGGFPLREGDKVMQIQNNYRLRLVNAPDDVKRHGKRGGKKPSSSVQQHLVSVMNGQVGYVQKINAAQSSVTVRFEGVEHDVLYLRSDEWRQLAPAYAMSIHRSQGSETPYAFIVLHRSMNPRLMDRCLLYTATTRAKYGVAFFAMEDDIARASQNTEARNRHSNLHRRLAEPRGKTPGEGRRRRMVAPVPPVARTAPRSRTLQAIAS